MFAPTTKILILDDMLTMRKIVKNTLKGLGYLEVQEAADGNQGWELLQVPNAGIQLIISDWNMPNCTGLELLKRVRGDARFASIPFVLLTAEAEAHQVKDALTSGVSGYVIKPFTPDSLKDKLEQVYKKVAG
jgi:two-component system, chemotaxis family, chemotaxis protein CheY